MSKIQEKNPPEIKSFDKKNEEYSWKFQGQIIKKSPLSSIAIITFRPEDT